MPSYVTYERAQLMMWYMHRHQGIRTTAELLAVELQMPSVSVRRTWNDYPIVFVNDKTMGGKRLSGRYPGDIEFDLETVAPWAEWLILGSRQEQKSNDREIDTTKPEGKSDGKMPAKFFDIGFELTVTNPNALEKMFTTNRAEYDRLYNRLRASYIIINSIGRPDHVPLLDIKKQLTRQVRDADTSDAVKKLLMEGAKHGR